MVLYLFFFLNESEPQLPMVKNVSCGKLRENSPEVVIFTSIFVPR